MNQGFKFFAATMIVATMAASAAADPQLFVNYEGTNGTNHEWSVAVAPDATYFSNTTSGFGSSMAVELAFKIEGSAVAPGTIGKNPLDWDFENFGNNPFTNGATDGLWISVDSQQLFAAYGSRVFLSDAPSLLFNFQTVGTQPTTVHYGVAAAGHPTKGSIIAQSGQNFPVGLAAGSVDEVITLLADMSTGMASGDSGFHAFTGYSGSVESIPEPCAAVLIVAGMALGGLVFGRRRS
jgi:hypothetical protein